MQAALMPDLRPYIRPNDRVFWSEGAAEPLMLTQAIVAQRAELGPLHAFVGITLSDTLLPEHADYISASSYGALGTTRRLAAAGVLDIIPCHVAMIGDYIRQGIVGCDVAVIQLSPPGPDGRHSFGVMNDYLREALLTAKVVLAEINEQMPWTYGNSLPESTRIDFSVCTSRPLLTAPSPPPRPVDRSIARHVASFIGDGSTLQLGVGATPDAVLGELGDRRDLGVHSGAISDALLDLIERGVVTNARKPIDRGKTITASLLGTQRLYRYAHVNATIQVEPFSYTHNAQVLKQLPDLVTVNSALEVDLTGQINAEASINGYVGGVGGHSDFVRAGHRSSKGHAIIALRSTTEDGRSRICFKMNGPVTTSRSDADVIVTEHGSAVLRGCSLRERVRRLVGIAHPEWRDKLKEEASLHGFNVL